MYESYAFTNRQYMDSLFVGVLESPENATWYKFLFYNKYDTRSVWQFQFLHLIYS